MRSQRAVKAVRQWYRQEWDKLHDLLSACFDNKGRQVADSDEIDRITDEIDLIETIDCINTKKGTK